MILILTIYLYIKAVTWVYIDWRLVWILAVWFGWFSRCWASRKFLMAIGTGRFVFSQCFRLQPRYHFHRRGRRLFDLITTFNLYCIVNLFNSYNIYKFYIYIFEIIFGDQFHSSLTRPSEWEYFNLFLIFVI